MPTPKKKPATKIHEKPAPPKRVLSVFAVYLAEKNIHPVEAARQLGLSRAHGNELRYRDASVGRKLRARIREWSKGAVGIDSWD